MEPLPILVFIPDGPMRGEWQRLADALSELWPGPVHPYEGRVLPQGEAILVVSAARLLPLTRELPPDAADALAARSIVRVASDEAARRLLNERAFLGMVSGSAWFDWIYSSADGDAGGDGDPVEAAGTSASGAPMAMFGYRAIAALVEGASVEPDPVDASYARLSSTDHTLPGLLADYLAAALSPAEPATLEPSPAAIAGSEEVGVSVRESVVVTGGTGGLGTAVVQALLDAGWTVHVPALQPADHRYLASWSLRDHPRVRLAPGVDLGDEAAVAAFYSAIKGLWASVHLAGGWRAAPVAETSAEDARWLMEINVVTTFLCCREAVKALRAAGGGGRVLNVSARPAIAPAGGMVAYAASKAAVAGLTQNLAEEVKGEGIWVNAVVPSIMNTPANRAAMPDADHGAWPSVEDVAAAIGFLVSRENALVTGALVPVTGTT
jgi:NAD(P)-dependent dehydrogenase (short-subunit alcohol dehydrogenase family)